MGTWLHLLGLAKFSACLNRNLTKWAGLVLAKKRPICKIPMWLHLAEG